MSITRDDILTVMREELFLQTDDIDDQTLLFSSGLIDSFSLVTLISAIEAKGGFRIDPLDITLENLDSIERMLLFASRKAV